MEIDDHNSSHRDLSQVSTRRTSLRSLMAAAGGLAVGMLAAPGEAHARLSLGDLQAQIDALNAQVAALSQRTTTAESNIMWSGGPQTHGDLPGPNFLRLEKTDFNTAADYLYVEPNGTIMFLVAGFYRIKLHALSLASADSYMISRLLFNGTVVQHREEFALANKWFGWSTELTWPCDVGDQVRLNVEILAGGYAYHAWSAVGSFTRLQVSFVGT